MAVETLGEAWKLGWRVRVRCAHYRSLKSGKRMVFANETTAELDMSTLIWTRGEAFPLKELSQRLRCPKCGVLDPQVIFEIPNNPTAVALRGKIDIDDYREEG